MSGLEMTPSEEEVAYSNYKKRYSQQEYLLTRPARTGWTRVAEDYKVCLWGSSLGDWLLFFLCFTILYACLILFFYVLFTLYLSDVEDNSTLYVFFFVGFVGATALASVVYFGNVEREHQAKLDARKAKQAAAQLAAAE